MLRRAPTETFRNAVIVQGREGFAHLRMTSAQKVAVFFFGLFIFLPGSDAATLSECRFPSLAAMCLGVDDPVSWRTGAHCNCDTQVILHNNPPATKVNIAPFPSKPNSLDGNHSPRPTPSLPTANQPPLSQLPTTRARPAPKTDARLAERHQAKVTKRPRKSALLALRHTYIQADSRPIPTQKPDASQQLTCTQAKKKVGFIGNLSRSNSHLFRPLLRSM